MDILLVFEQLEIQEAAWSGGSEENQRDWFRRFSRVLVHQVISTRPFVEKILAATSFTQEHLLDIEDCLFSLVVFTVRFIQGINWGYSE